MDTPLLIIAWRRPHTLRLVIEAIRPIAPSRLFVACDGPNPERPEEIVKVADTRDVIEKEINWPCKIEYLYSDANLGCRMGVSRAISWFFDHVEEGIILEDDCVPHPDFFYYCTTLLEFYRDDTRVWCISGNNFQNGLKRGDGSYYFSRYNHVWGWASWRRSWTHYDHSLLKWPSLRDSGLLSTIFDDPIERRYWFRIWDTLFSRGIPDTWDYQWMFTCLINGGLTACPCSNLIENVGFGRDATHTTGIPIDTQATEGIDAIIHPSFILRDTTADRYTFDHHFCGKSSRFLSRLARLPKQIVRTLFGKL